MGTRIKYPGQKSFTVGKLTTFVIMFQCIKTSGQILCYRYKGFFTFFYSKLLKLILPMVSVALELKILNYHVRTGWENLNAEIVLENEEVYSR